MSAGSCGTPTAATLKPDANVRCKSGWGYRSEAQTQPVAANRAPLAFASHKCVTDWIDATDPLRSDLAFRGPACSHWTGMDGVSNLCHVVPTHPLEASPFRLPAATAHTTHGSPRDSQDPDHTRANRAAMATYYTSPQFRGSSALYHQQTKNLLTAPTPTLRSQRAHLGRARRVCPTFPGSGPCGIEADDLPQGCHTRNVDSSTAVPTRMLRLTCPVLLRPVQHWRSACGRRQMKTGPPEAASPKPSVRRLRIGRLPDLAPPPATRSPPHPAQNQHGTGHQG